VTAATPRRVGGKRTVETFNCEWKKQDLAEGTFSGIAKALEEKRSKQVDTRGVVYSWGTEAQIPTQNPMQLPLTHQQRGYRRGGERSKNQEEQRGTKSRTKTRHAPGRDHHSEGENLETMTRLGLGGRRWGKGECRGWRETHTSSPLIFINRARKRATQEIDRDSKEKTQQRNVSREREKRKRSGLERHGSWDGR